MNKVISYGKQSIEKDDIAFVLEALKSDWLTQGPLVDCFEKDLACYFGAKHCSVVSNGTAALHLAGLALGWKSEDIVLTSPITFLATANSIVYSGAMPDFIDIDPKTYTIDPNKIEDKIKNYRSKGKFVKAIIGVDFAGHPCDWKALRYIADKYNLNLVNDNCHALGAEYFGNKQYALKYADIVTQSYHPVKHITTGEGGALFTNNSDIDYKVRSLRTHGTTKDRDSLDNSHGAWYYEMHELGYNYRITDIQCALGISQLKKLDQFINKRQYIAKQYDKSLSNINYIKTPEIHTSVKHSYHLYPLQINFDKLQITKKKLFKLMKQIGINLQVHYIPVHIQPYYKNNFGFKLGDFPISEKFYGHEISLPIYPDLLIKDISFVINKLKDNLSP